MNKYLSILLYNFYSKVKIIFLFHFFMILDVFLFAFINIFINIVSKKKNLFSVFLEEN